MSENKLKVFIGSSTESLPVAKEISKWIAVDRKHIPITWKDLNVFGPGKFIFESVQKAAENHGAAIFVFGEDDEVIRGDENVFTVRGNVLIEFGYFVAKLGRERVLICVDGNPEIASNLHGIKIVKMEDKPSAKAEITEFLDEIQPLRDIDRVLLDTGKGPLITVGLRPAKHGGGVIGLDFELFVDGLKNVVGECKMLYKFEPHVLGAYGAEIHYGTPAINYYVNYYLTNKIPGFKWRITKENYGEFEFETKENEWGNTGFVKYVDDNDWQGFEISNVDREFRYEFGKRDCAFLLRLGSKNFPGAPRTVHVLFGAADYGRQAALGYFLNNLNTIHKNYGSDDYLLFVEVDQKSALIGEFENIYDEVFKK
ncbi:MAG: nucleotide-binding protein [Bacteroidales bacterium]|jgi:hypothetical protein|nr:nucleotide-binding protein [Bacteroidales bacterium]